MPPGLPGGAGGGRSSSRGGASPAGRFGNSEESWKFGAGGAGAGGADAGVGADADAPGCHLEGPLRKVGQGGRGVE